MTEESTTRQAQDRINRAAARLLADEQRAKTSGDRESHRAAIEAQQAAGMDMRAFRFSRGEASGNNNEEGSSAHE